MRGVANPSTTDALFHPDLNVFPPLLASGVLLEGDALPDLVKMSARALSTWHAELATRHQRTVSVRMRDALQEIERAQPAPGSRAPWWVASAFVEGLLHGGFAIADETKRAAGRIDRYLAAFASGVRASAELMRELLFHLAHCEPVTPLVRDVKSLYELDRYFAPSASGRTSSRSIPRSSSRCCVRPRIFSLSPDMPGPDRTAHQ